MTNSGNYYVQEMMITSHLPPVFLNTVQKNICALFKASLTFVSCSTAVVQESMCVQNQFFVHEA